jgi:hypothetical protein
MGIKTKIVMALVVTLLLLPGVSHALTDDQAVLVGVKEVVVIVERVNPIIERRGLTGAQIRADVELRLRRAGVRVMAEMGPLKTWGLPHLWVTVKTPMRPVSGLLAYSVRVSLCESIAVSVWDTESRSTVGIDNIGQIRGAVGLLVNKFINDYLAANPKK